MKMKKLLVVWCSATLLAGCATMNKDECVNADWNLIGFEDASKGYPLDRIGQHRKACAGTNVVPVLADYEKGHQKGARVFCTVPRGYQDGLGGGTYRSICPPDLEEKFSQAFHDGQDLYAIKQRIGAMASKSDEYHKLIAQYRSEIDNLEGAIVNADGSAASRRSRLEEVKDLERDIADLERDDAAVEREIMLLENDYQKLLRQHKAWGY
jgi:hypothetical protein